MNVIPYLSFEGTCREAFTFYADLLGGEATFLTFDQVPSEEQMPPEMKDGIMNASLHAGDVVLMASDAYGDRYERPRGIYISLQVESVDDAERYFNAFADGGRVVMPFEETFWVERFGMVIDRFGTPWMLNAGQPRGGY
jgi:PhnB protein